MRPALHALPLALLAPVAAQDLQPPAGAEPARRPAAPVEIVAAPSGARTWLTFEGERLDHLGIGAAALGDIDGDGADDFLLGSLSGAYTFCCGRGWVRAISGRDGSELYRVTGREGKGDGFGDTMFAVGDLDGDDVPDFAVGAWYADLFGEAATNRLEYVRVYSGRDGELLRHADAPEAFDGFGSWLRAAGDVDGDGCGDVAVGTQCSPMWANARPDTQVVSGATGDVLDEYRGLVEGPTVDLNGDGMHELLVSVGASSVLRSGVDGAVLATLVAGPGEGAAELGRGAADFDGDGALDPITVRRAAPEQEGGPRPVWLTVHDGAGPDRAPLLRARLADLKGIDAVYPRVLGDASGDGVPELAVGAQGRVLVLDGATGAVRSELRSPGSSATFGEHLVPVGDVDGDGAADLLVTDYESQRGPRCGGRAWVVVGL